LKDALQYHERITDIQQGMDNIQELIEKKISEITKDEDENNCLDNALECVPVEVEGAMKDFKNIGNKFDEVNVEEMIMQLNTDQKLSYNKSLI